MPAYMFTSSLYSRYSLHIMLADYCVSMDINRLSRDLPASDSLSLNTLSLGARAENLSPPW